MRREDRLDTMLDGPIWDELQTTVARFRAAMARGDRPAIEAYLPADGAHRAVFLAELVHEELEHRARAGEAVSVQSYLDRFEELRSSTLFARGLDEAVSFWRAPGRALHPGAPLQRDPASIGRYELGEVIGRGAFGVVHRAYDATLRRAVGAQAAPARRRGDPRGGRALPPRGPRRGRAAASRHRADPRRRRGRRRSLPGQRPDRGPQPGRRAGRPPPGFPPVGRVDRRPGRGARARPLPRPDPPRRQAVERADRRRGPRLPDRLRPGQERRRRCDADGRRPVDRHAGLHGARAGRGRARGRSTRGPTSTAWA